MTTREQKLREMVSQWKRECMVFADMPDGIPVPKRLYLWNRIDELASILNEEVDASDQMCAAAEHAYFTYRPKTISPRRERVRYALTAAITAALKEAGK